MNSYLKELKKNKIVDKTLKILFGVLIILAYLFIPVLFARFFMLDLGMTNKVLVTVIASFLTLLILLLLFNKRIARDFKDYKKHFKKYFLFSLKWWGIGLVIMMISNLIINLIVMGGNTVAGNEEAVRKLMVTSPWLMMLSACLFAPISEEIAFRLSFKNAFKNAIPFAIVTGLIFAGMHVATDFHSPLQLLYFIPYGGLGFAFGYIFFKTDNIFSSITMHFLHNTIIYSLLLISFRSLL